MKLPLWLWLGSLFVFTGCSRVPFVDYAMDFATKNDNLVGYELLMSTTDGKDVHYLFNMSQEQSKNMVISFKDLPASITATVSPFTYSEDYEGTPLTNFTVQYETKNTSAGYYYVHLYTKSKEGLYREVIQPIHVEGFSVDALTGKNFSIQDTLSSSPFNGASPLNMSSYNMNIIKKTGGADNEFVMSTMGTNYPFIWYFNSVEASLDTQSGLINVPSQNISGIMVSGHGALVFASYHSNKYKGYIIYQYQSSSGGNYEGKVTF